MDQFQIDMAESLKRKIEHIKEHLMKMAEGLEATHRLGLAERYLNKAIDFEGACQRGRAEEWLREAGYY